MTGMTVGAITSGI